MFGTFSRLIASKAMKVVCYVSLNRPYKTVLEEFKKMGINPEAFYFIDAVSSKVGSVETSKRVIFVSSPQAMTELSISINKSIGTWKPGTVLFDSLSTLLVYEGASSVLRFIHSVVSWTSSGLPTRITITA